MIRKANETDIPRIEELSKRFYYTTDYVKFAPHSPEAIRFLTETLVKDGVVLVAQLEDEVVGVAGLILTPFMFNHSIIGAYEVVFYIEPEAQGLGVGGELLSAIEPACREAGASLVQMIHLHNSPPQAAKMYEKLGYRYSESCYSKVL